MAQSSWSQLYDEAKTGVVAGLPGGTYQVEVADARPFAKSRLLFIDLNVLVGPSAGKTAQVSLYLPEAGNRGAGFHFRKKIMGFGDLTEAFRQMDSTSDVEGALSILADALKGRKVSAEIDLRSDGEYAGTNQLSETKPADDAAPAPAPAPAPAGPTAAAPASAEAEPAADAMSGEVPF